VRNKSAAVTAAQKNEKNMEIGTYWIADENAGPENAGPISLQGGP